MYLIKYLKSLKSHEIIVHDFNKINVTLIQGFEKWQTIVKLQVNIVIQLTTNNLAINLGSL